MNIWDLFECFESYKKIISNEEHGGGKNSDIFVNVSTGSKGSSVAVTMACMIWKGTPYYAHIEYNDKTDPENGLQMSMLMRYTSRIHPDNILKAK